MIHKEKEEGFDGWLEKAEEDERTKLGVIVSEVEMFRDIDDIRERCACDKVWQEEQYKRVAETGEKFDGWNEYDPCTRLAEGEQVIETFDEGRPHMPEMFEDFPETGLKEEREAIWTEEPVSYTHLTLPTILRV